MASTICEKVPIPWLMNITTEIASICWSKKKPLQIIDSEGCQELVGCHIALRDWVLNEPQLVLGRQPHHIIAHRMDDVVF